MRRIVLAALALGLASCVTSDNEEQFGRPDCRLVSEPEIGSRFALDRQFCLGRATAAAGAWRGRGDVRHGVMLSCMAERGYIYAPRRDHDARCRGVRTSAPIASPTPVAPRETPPPPACHGRSNDLGQLACASGSPASTRPPG